MTIGSAIPLAVLTDFCRDKSMTSIGDGCVIKFPRTEQQTKKLWRKTSKNWLEWELHYEHEVGNFSWHFGKKFANRN